MSPRSDHSPSLLPLGLNRVSKRYKPPAGTASRMPRQVPSAEVSIARQPGARASGAPDSTRTSRASTVPPAPPSRPIDAFGAQRPESSSRAIPSGPCCHMRQSSAPASRKAPHGASADLESSLA